jgi:uncharacterized FAD-dependent dehydrogenase
MPILVANVPLPEETPSEAQLRAAVAARLGLPETRLLELEVVKRALDGRSRPPTWRMNLRVGLDSGEAEVLSRGIAGVRAFNPRDEARRSGSFPIPEDLRWTSRPIVVGAGPAGLFAALRLGEAGAPAILLERGQPVEKRVPAVNGFWRGGALDPDNNILFGEGGAGTFSDGKIYTRRRDGELGYVFRALVEAGADPGILQESWAHLGTDKVRAILPALRARILDLGVEIRFGAGMESLLVEEGRCVGVRLHGGEELRGGPVIVAAGHSARDVMQALLEAGAAAEVRPIAVGARIEHPQALIDAARYPKGRGDLPPASYRLADSPEPAKVPKGPARRDPDPQDTRAAYTFCMCPGGMVVPAQEQDGRSVVNGMSFAARRAMWANSALIVQVGPEDYGADDPLAGVRYQESIEARAHAFVQGHAGDAPGAAWRAPMQRVSDFLAGRASVDLPRTSYPFGGVPCDLSAILPAPVVRGMRRAIRRFDKEIPGFAGPEGVLIAPETRTTSPVRFLRGPQLESPTLPGLVPCGEGAGWAGGIVSAALDGFRAAEAAIQGLARHRSEAGRAR